MAENILIVDDDSSIRTSLGMTLKGKYIVSSAENGNTALNLMNKHKPELILLDIGLPDMSGMDLLERVRKTDPDTAVIMITAFEETQTVVEAMKLGALDYLVKPLDGNAVKTAVHDALESKHFKDKVRAIRQPKVEDHNFEMIGHSPKMRALVSTVEKAAKSVDTPILITGESGTGKSHLAKAIHYRYSEPRGPLVTVNCTALTHELFESELFGYERGAFTGARSEGKTGRFEEAAGGTLFLDEIGSISLSAQSKLLGVLEDRSFYRVGGKKPVQVSCRIIAASNLDLEKAVQQGHFRADLYFRLNVVKLEVPPLRERPEDIILITKRFMEHYKKKFGKRFTEVSPKAEAVLEEYSWPGNVRELRNLLEKVILLEDDDTLRWEHISFLEGKAGGTGDGQSSPRSMDYYDVVGRLIQDALKRSKGNVLEASRILNMPAHKVRYRIKMLGLKNDTPWVDHIDRYYDLLRRNKPDSGRREETE
jgi:two-component system, NtrC family, response regulator AtoC